MSFAAKYAGCCLALDECVYNGHICEGDEVMYSSHDELMHVECARRQRNPAPTCSSCGLVHRGECDW